MKIVRLACLVCLCAIAPGIARTAEGGWIDWLEKWSGPRMVGIGHDLHFCIDKDGKAINCNEFFGYNKIDHPFKTIKHEFDFRVGVYHNVGERFKGDTAPNAVADDRSVWASKLMVFYHFHPYRTLEVGGGMGMLPVWGDGVELFSRGIVTPVSVVVAPPEHAPAGLRPFFVRIERSYVTQGFKATDFGNTKAAYDTQGGEWQWSVAVGFDFRRQ